eukprot:350460-Pyramimonas_sp.AAC.1
MSDVRGATNARAGGPACGTWRVEPCEWRRLPATLCASPFARGAKPKANHVSARPSARGAHELVERPRACGTQHVGPVTRGGGARAGLAALARGGGNAASAPQRVNPSARGRVPLRGSAAAPVWGRWP